MRSRMFTSGFIAFALSATASTAAIATAQRTFVASYGNDANPCSLTQPCRGFAAAVAQTLSTGEVIVLDSGGYGAVTINQSISIIAPPGVYAGITVPSGNGITIDGTAIEVVLRGLTVNGQGGSFGIFYVQGAKLTVEDCEVSNMTSTGILVAGGQDFIVRNTIVRGNVSGIVTGYYKNSLDRVRVDNNKNLGIFCQASTVTITDSILSNNPGIGILTQAGFGSSISGVTRVTVSHSSVTGSANALSVSAETGHHAILVSDSNVLDNASNGAFLFNGGGGAETIYTTGTNTVGSSVATVVIGGTLTLTGQY